jgi:hypothetical protein
MLPAAMGLALVSCRTTPPDAGPVTPPPGAVVLFDGTRTDGWRHRDGTQTGWRLESGVLVVKPGDGDAVSMEEIGDGRLHVEFNLPRVNASGQSRANSGVYVMGRWEVQVLDCWENETYEDGTCGALYGLVAPTSLAPKPPGHWQAYDIDFRAPRVGPQGVVTTSGRITVLHNGTRILEDAPFDRVTTGGLDETIVSRGPVLLQDHGSPVRFRNIWWLPALEK